MDGPQTLLCLKLPFQPRNNFLCIFQGSEREINKAIETFNKLLW